MTSKIKALLLEDIRKDAELLEEMLTDRGLDLNMDVVENKVDYISKLTSNNYDVIFADFTLPSFNGQDALKLAKEICPAVPFICISGTIGEDKAVELLKQGATDYVLKDRMERLPFATKRALDEVSQKNQMKETEIELQTHRRFLETIITNALDAIYIKNTQGIYVLINKAAENVIGKTSSEVIGKDDTFFLAEEEARMIIQDDKMVINKGIPMTFEETLTLADANQHIFLTVKCPIFDESGNITGLFGIARDITDRKQMEQSLSQAKEKAEESDRLKTAFLQNISHEIRTPMNAIIGFSDFIVNQDLDSGKRKQYSEILFQSCQQLLSIISDIVSIASIETGQVNINESKIKLNETLKFTFNQFLIKAKIQQICLKLSLFCEEEIEIISDETKLTQVLGNLINNALKFTKQGFVNFGYHIIEQDNGKFIKFFVEDTGIGIPGTMSEEIFKRFRQVDEGNTGENKGSGLGLSISKAYVELLGGKIWFDSEPGKGSTFYFTIPYVKSEDHKTANSPIHEHNR